MELIVFKIIAGSGDATSKYITAMSKASEGKYEEVEKLLAEGDASLKEAHLVQTELIQKEANGEKMEISFLTIHAQDHLMNAMMLKELSRTMIKFMKRMDGKNE